MGGDSIEAVWGWGAGAIAGLAGDCFSILDRVVVCRIQSLLRELVADALFGVGDAKAWHCFGVGEAIGEGEVAQVA